MASIQDAYDALMGHLQAMPGRPSLVYPNGPKGAPLPRIVVSYVAPAQRTHDMSGMTDAVAEISARIETAEGDFAVEAGAILAALQEQFRAATRIGGVTIMETPRPASAYALGGVYHCPVTIRGRYFF